MKRIIISNRLKHLRLDFHLDGIGNLLKIFEEERYLKYDIIRFALWSGGIIGLFFFENETNNTVSVNGYS